MADDREGIHKAEQLDLENLILHRPVHELVGPEGRGKEAPATAPRLLDEGRTDFEDASLEGGVGRRLRPRAGPIELRGGENSDRLWGGRAVLLARLRAGKQGHPGLRQG